MTFASSVLAGIVLKRQINRFDLVADLGIDIWQLRCLEHRENPCRADLQRRIAEALGVSAEMLFDGAGYCLSERLTRGGARKSPSFNGAALGGDSGE